MLHHGLLIGNAVTGFGLPFGCYPWTMHTDHGHSAVKSISWRVAATTKSTKTSKFCHTYITLDSETFRGANVVRGSLNWGPITWLNGVWKTYGWWSQRRALYADDFHTYTLEWTPDFFKIYVDTPLHHMLELDMRK